MIHNLFKRLIAAIWPKLNTVERIDSRVLRIKLPPSPVVECYNCDSTYNVEHFNYCPCLDTNEKAHRRF